MILDKIDTVFKGVEKNLIVISWIATLIVTFMIVIDVFSRYIFNKPLPASWELSEFFMSYIVFFAFAYTLTINAHVRMSLVIDRVPKTVRFGFEIFTDTISFILCTMLAYFSWLYFWDSFKLNEEMLAAIWIPWWVAKLAMPIGVGMFAIRYLFQLILHFSPHVTTVPTLCGNVSNDTAVITR